MLAADGSAGKPSDTADGQQTQQPPADGERSKSSEKGDHSSLSSFAGLAAWFTGGGREDEDDESPQKQEDEHKNEHLIVYITKKIRNKLIARKLVGQIMIHRLFGVVVTRMHCIVSAGDEMTAEDDENDGNDPMKELDRKYKRAITTTDMILNSLERRSRAWDGLNFADDVSLTRGATIGVSDPIVGMIGFAFTYEITCTVKSLLASRKRFEAARESVSRESLLSTAGRGISFSFTGSRGSTASSSLTATAGVEKESGEEAAASRDKDKGKFFGLLR